MSSIVIQKISKSFGVTSVLKDISLTIKDGEFVSLLGPSGCGKSTLLRLIAGLDVAERGSIVVGQHDVTRLHPKDRDLAMVFQSYALYPHLSVYDNIAVPLRMRRLNVWQRLPGVRLFSRSQQKIEREIRQDIHEVAQTLGIQALLPRKPAQLSGGQRQRVALGRAMVRKPEAFLMDEPLSNLDAKLRVHMRSELSQLHRTLGATFLYVTHDQAEALTMSDRIAVMMEGSILQYDTPDEIYRNPSDLRVAEFVGSPRINMLQGWVREGKLELFETEQKTLARSYLALSVDAPHGLGVVVAFRSEQCSLVPAGQAALQGVVTHCENLGSDTLVHVRAKQAKDPIIVRIAAQAPQVKLGTLVGVSLSMLPLVFSEQGPRLSVRVTELDEQPVAPVLAFEIA
ncbi:MAG: ABC transporter ATP-binding protein [Alcaligenaceae bacterium]